MRWGDGGGLCVRGEGGRVLPAPQLWPSEPMRSEDDWWGVRGDRFGWSVLSFRGHERSHAHDLGPRDPPPPWRACCRTPRALWRNRSWSPRRPRWRGPWSKRRVKSRYRRGTASIQRPDITSARTQARLIPQRPAPPWRWGPAARAVDLGLPWPSLIPLPGAVTSGFNSPPPSQAGMYWDRSSGGFHSSETGKWYVWDGVANTFQEWK